MKPTNILVTASYLLWAFTKAQDYEYSGPYASNIQIHQLQNANHEIPHPSTETETQLNQSNTFIAAGEGYLPNCQIYGRTYCTEIEGYPE